jgi:uncharacterized protein with NRDE domain
MVMNKNGRLSTLTNVLNPTPDTNKLGRGRLVVDFCQSNSAPNQYFESLSLPDYNPFNLLMIDILKEESFFFNSKDENVTDLNDGKCHVMSNSTKVDSEWLKANSLLGMI